MFAIPVIALVSSMLVFGERLSATEWLGIGCIGAGLAIISLQAVRAPRDVATADADRRRLIPALRIRCGGFAPSSGVPG